MSIELVKFDERPAEPIPEVIEALKWLLEAAERGEVRTLAVVALRAADVSSTRWCYTPGMGNALLGRLVRLSSELSRSLEEHAVNFEG